MFRELRAHGIANGSYGIVSRGFVIIIVMRALRSNGIHPPEWIKTGLWHMYLGMFDAALFIFPQSGFFLKTFFLAMSLTGSENASMYRFTYNY